MAPAEHKMLGNFAQGEVVKLKTGGPTMTVERVVGQNAAWNTAYDYGIHCVWFDDRNQLQRDIFFADMIEAA